MPEAFVCNNDEAAFRLVECLNQAGYAAPEDVAVAGYDDFRYSTMCRPQLTTYHVNIEGMAAAAVECIQRRLSNQPSMGPVHIVSGTFIKRDST